MSEKTIEEIVNGSYMLTPLDTRVSGLLLNEEEEPYIVYIAFHTVGQMYVSSIFVNKELGRIIHPLVSSMYAISENQYGEAYKRVLEKIVSLPDMPASLVSFGSKDVVVEIIAVEFGSEESMPIMSKVVYPIFMDTKYAIKITNDIIGDDPSALLNIMSSSYSDMEEMEDERDGDITTADDDWDYGIYM